VQAACGASYNANFSQALLSHNGRSACIRHARITGAGAAARLWVLL